MVIGSLGVVVRPGNRSDRGCPSPVLAQDDDLDLPIVASLSDEPVEDVAGDVEPAAVLTSAPDKPAGEPQASAKRGRLAHVLLLG